MIDSYSSMKGNLADKKGFGACVVGFGRRKARGCCDVARKRVADYEVVSWNGLVRSLPHAAEIVNKLNAALQIYWPTQR